MMQKAMIPHSLKKKKQYAVTLHYQPMGPRYIHNQCLCSYTTAKHLNFGNVFPDTLPGLYKPLS